MSPGTRGGKARATKPKGAVGKKRLEEEKAKEEALLASIGDGIIATDRDGMIVVMNTAAKEMLGWTTEEVIGKNLFEIVVVEDEQGETILKNKQAVSTVFKTGEPVMIDSSYYVGKDKQRLPVAINVTPVVLDGKIIGTVNVFRDITEEKKLERAKKEFISIAIHQLKTPLTGLRWTFESLRIPPELLDDKQKEYLKYISGFLDSLSRTMEDLLNVSRAELGTLNTDFQNINFQAFMKKFVGEIKPYAESQSTRLVVSGIDDATLHVPMDVKILTSVLQNLVSNAIEYSPAETEVNIKVKTENNHLKVSITNQGQAISKEAKRRIFEKFYRAPEAKRIKAGGTGIGLYIVKLFVEKLGGNIGFESEEGKDTVFWFTIPIEPKLLKS